MVPATTYVLNLNPFIFTMYFYCGLVVWYKYWKRSKTHYDLCAQRLCV